MTRVRAVAWLYHIQRRAAPVARWYFDLRAFGSDRVPRTEGVLLCPNHASYLDPWFIGWAVDQRPWRNLMTDRWYNRGRFFRWFFRASGTIPTTRGEPERTVRRVVNAVAAGHGVTVFPEGGLSRDGRLRKGRSGIAWMAACSGAPVFPCGIRGNFEAYPRHARVPRRHPVEVHVGEPLYFPGAPLEERPDANQADEFVRALMSSIAVLSGQAKGSG